MKKGILFLLGILFFLSAFSFVSAVDTEINIRTRPDYKVSIFVLDPGKTYLLLDSFHINSGGEGEVSVIYSGDEDEVKINVKVVGGVSTNLLEKFGIFETGEALYLQVIPGDISDNYKADDEEEEEAAATANESANEDSQEGTDDGSSDGENDEDNEDVVDDETVSVGSSGITGWAIFGGGEVPRTVYFIIGLVLVGVVMAIIVFKGVVPRLRKDPAYNYKPVKSGMEEHSPKKEKVEEELLAAERKIQEARATINRLQNQDKIADAEKKLKADQEALEKLKRGED